MIPVPPTQEIQSAGQAPAAEQQAGQAPATPQPVTPVGQAPAATQAAPAQPAPQTEIERLRREAAGYRTAKNDALADAEQMRVKFLEAEARAATMAASAATAKVRILETALDAGLLAAGIQDKETRDLLMPGVAAKVAASGVAVGDDLRISGDYAAVIVAAVAKVGVKPQPAANPATRGFAALLPSPQPERAPTPLTGRAALAARLKALREREGN